MTTTIPLTCDGFANALADYLERDDTPRVRAAVEAHAASCASCGALLADVQQLRIDAGGLPTLSPPRDLWDGIASRIETPVVAIGARGDAREPAVAGNAESGLRRRRWMLPAAAAAALVIVTAGVTYVATRQAVLTEAQLAASSVDSATLDPRAIAQRAHDSARREIGDVPMVAGMSEAIDGGQETRTDSRVAATRRPAAQPPSSVPAMLVGDQAPIAAVETVYGREIARLWRIVDDRRALLDTATVGVIERNLAIIDGAIRESRAALARDPASAFLNEQLNHVLEQKVELLRAAALLPARS